MWNDILSRPITYYDWERIAENCKAGTIEIRDYRIYFY